MNFLIIGGNGYIGSKITRELIIDGHSVVCTKRSSSNLKRLSDVDEKVRWIPASIDGIETAMQYVNFDYVLNLACNYGRGGFFNDEVIEANIEFPLKVLNTAVKYGISKYLTIGTGLPDKFNMYSFTKKVFSEFGRFYAEKHHITFINMLLEMFYGADEPKDRFIPATISKMIKGETVETTIGNQRRDIISVSDIIMAIKTVIYSNISGFTEIPVGTGTAPTISEVVDFIWKETGKKSKVLKGAVPVRNTEPDCVADTTILSRIVEWNPVPWKTGIRHMITTMKSVECK